LEVLVPSRTKLGDAMARDKQLFEDVDDGEDGYSGDDTYFTYRPLSNLPTPPLSSRNSSANHSPKTELEDGEPLKAKFLGRSSCLGMP